MVEIHENIESAQKPGQKPSDQDRAVFESLKQIKNKFIIMSGKGGVGKTSVSVNLAMALAGQGYHGCGFAWTGCSPHVGTQGLAGS